MRFLSLALCTLLLTTPVSAQTIDDLVRWQAEKDAPETPKQPAPASASVGAASSVTLTWQSVGATGGYDVYLGTSSTPAKVASVTTPSYQPSALIASTKYYWKIIAKNPKGTMTGPVWTFTTAAVAPPAPTPVPPPPTTPSPTASPDGSRVPPLASLTDAGGHVWTLSGLQTMRDGVWTASGMGTILAWCGGSIYTLGTDSAWYQFVTSWTRVGAADPCVAPVPAPVPVPPPPPPPPSATTGATIAFVWDAPAGATITTYRLTLDGSTTTDVPCCQGVFYRVASGTHTVAVASVSGTSLSPFVPVPPLTVVVP